jgi:ABC-2 type transport system ATP-binding protein
VFRSSILDILQDFLQDERHSILISSHITSDLERVADYITFLHRGRVLLSESKDLLLEEYGLLKCGEDQLAQIDRSGVVQVRRGRFGCEALVRDRGSDAYRGLTIDRRPSTK